MIYSTNTKGPAVFVGHPLQQSFPFSYAHLCGYLIDQGEHVAMLFRPHSWDAHRALAEKLIAMKPLFVGLGNLYPEIYAVKDVIAWIDKLGRDFPIIIGGHMVTPTPEFTLEITGADVGVLGEGEIIVHSLTVALREKTDLVQVKGLVLREGREFVNTGPGPYIKDMSKLPDIPYHLFPSEKWTTLGKRFTFVPQPQWRYKDRAVFVHGGRGCPFECNFCYHHSRPRYRDINVMMEEAFELLDRFDCNVINFNDDLVLATPERAASLTEILGRYKGKRKIAYRVSCRFDILDRIDDELLKAMKETGCRVMPMGVESGSQRILDVMKKRTRVEQILRGVERLANAGIYVSGNMMIGQITETVEDADMSIKLAVELVHLNKHIQLSSTITTPFPGTEIYKYALDNLILRDDRDFFDRFKNMGDISVNVSRMTDKELLDRKKVLDVALIKAKEDAVGRGALYVEHKIKQLADFDASSRSCVLKKAGRFYDSFYDFTQHSLDMARRYLRGVD